MLGSKNKFFDKSDDELDFIRDKVKVLLGIKGYSSEEINVYLEAFDFCSVCKNLYDGATIVKDLVDIPGLDLDAMLHDYHYYVYDCASNFKYKTKVDWIYAKGMERKGKGSYSSFSRLFGLSTVGLLFLIYAIIKRGKMVKHQKESIDNHYRLLIG